MLIESFGCIIFRVDHEGTNSCNAGGVKCPEHGIFQQRSPDPFALPVRIYGEPCEQHNRNSVMREPFDHSLWRLFILNRPDRKGVITDNGLLSQTHVGF